MLGKPRSDIKQVHCITIYKDNMIKTNIRYKNLGTSLHKNRNLPQKAIWVRRKPRPPQSRTAISWAEPGLNSDEPKKLRPINQATILITELPRGRKRVECPEGVFRFAASKNGNGRWATEGGDGEDGSGEADEEGDEWKDDNGQGRARGDRGRIGF